MVEYAVFTCGTPKLGLGEPRTNCMRSSEDAGPVSCYQELIHIFTLESNGQSLSTAHLSLMFAAVYSEEKQAGEKKKGLPMKRAISNPMHKAIIDLWEWKPRHAAFSGTSG